MLITILQALQLVALAPCIFVILFLIASRRPPSDTLIPILYFSALAASFLIPLMDVWPDWEPYSRRWGKLYGSLLFMTSLLPALSFLLIMQLFAGALFSRLYWLILAVPLLGGSSVVYASVVAPEICVDVVGCVASSTLRDLYSIFATALIFLLLIVEFTRLRRQLDTQNKQWRDRYWLMIALVILNLCVVSLELNHVADEMNDTEFMLAVTLLRMSFIYLVLTLLFRLFDRTQSAAALNDQVTERDQQLADAFKALMDEEKLYREMSCNREMVARRLDVSENMLSRVISLCFQQRFTEIVNGYRVEEAKERLVSEPDEAITTIAFNVGFNSIPSFNRVFKDVTGMSPRDYRNQATQS